MRAYSLIRAAPWYRREAFAQGLRAAGYEVFERGPDRARPGDVLLIWNRYAGNHEIATRFEREGGRVLVAENGYIGAGGTAPKFDVHPAGPKPGHYYALGLGFHNDHERVIAGGPERFAALGVELRPWRTQGEHILICPNRSFGVGEQVMRVDWAERCQNRLRRATGRPVRIRAHPGNDAPRRPISDDLVGAWAVYVWSSTVAAHALAAGIPTFIEAPHQILRPASATGSPDAPVCPDRLPHLERLAWAQWTCEEISRGEPFRYLLPATEQGAVKAGA